jgi:hypothetical protein
MQVLKQIHALYQMDRQQLRQRWGELMGKQAPNCNQEYLIKRLAYRLQELAYGGITDTAQIMMGSLLQQEGYSDQALPPRRKQTKPTSRPLVGTRLLREWNGKCYEVTVTEQGYEYRGRCYQSLSAIAKLITGTQWNGPAFFGLRKQGGKGARG